MNFTGLQVKHVSWFQITPVNKLKAMPRGRSEAKASSDKQLVLLNVPSVLISHRNILPSTLPWKEVT